MAGPTPPSPPLRRARPLAITVIVLIAIAPLAYRAFRDGQADAVGERQAADTAAPAAAAPDDRSDP